MQVARRWHKYGRNWHQLLLNASSANNIARIPASRIYINSIQSNSYTRYFVSNLDSMASSNGQPLISAAMTTEQEEAFKVWVGSHNWRTRPSMQTARDFLLLKYSQSFSEDEMNRIIDEVYANRAAPPEPMFIMEQPGQAHEPTSQDVTMPAHNSKFKFPGYGLPVSFMPDNDEHFPVLMGDSEDGWRAATLLIREFCMLKVIEDLTNKPEWWRKVRDLEIVAKWKTEILAVDWPAYHEHADFTPKMADAVSDLSAVHNANNNGT